VDYPALAFINDETGCPASQITFPLSLQFGAARKAHFLTAINKVAT
jgi:hypothetical protein